jgi:IS5 family transposase
LEGKKETGRPGMSLWEILVLGCVRLNLDIDYDMLHNLSNEHIGLRSILGIHRMHMDAGKEYGLSTIKENVRLLDEQTLGEISKVVVKAGHELKKKGPGADKLGLHLKTDTYAVESNIHFPTDLNLLWDCFRSCIRVIALINCMLQGELKDWRKLKWWGRRGKNLYRIASEIHRKKGKDYTDRLLPATESYLDHARKMSKKLEESYADIISKGGSNILIDGLVGSLRHYHKLLDKHIDLVDRRILQGEKIPHEEKIFSIFEPHVEWLQKGKANNKVELGHNVLITTDQFHFIVDHHVVIKEVDKALLKPLLERLKEQFDKTLYELLSLSSDKGFYTNLGKQAVAKDFKQAIIPKKGKRTPGQEEEEKSADFVKLRHAHSAIESNINELEHSGLNKVPDKTLVGFRRYVALGVVAYNLKRLGRIVIKEKLLETGDHKATGRKKAA